MDLLGRAKRLSAVLALSTWCGALALTACCGPLASPLSAQIFPSPNNNRFELSDSVHLDELDSAAKQHLERVRAFVANKQWDEAIETLRQVMESQGGRVVAAEPSWYLNVRDYCQLQIARLPAEAREMYRGRVDSLASKWFDEGCARRDPEPLQRLIEQLFCSSYGDDALLALGEIALERGDLDVARALWDRLLERPPADLPLADFERVRRAADLPADDVALLDRSYEPDARRSNTYARLRPRPPTDSWSDAELQQLARIFRERGISSARLAYPGTDIPLADIRARHVLLAVLEGPRHEAEAALASFRQQYPGSRGRLAGREVDYAESLAALLDQSSSWPRRDTSQDWPTFAGAAERNRIARGPIDIAAPKWKVSLTKIPATESSPQLRRVAEDRDGLLSYYPVVVGDLLLMNNQHDIVAFDIKTGRAAWPGADTQPTVWDQARIFRFDEPSGTSSGRSRLGVPRFTMTVYDRKVYARMGNPVTSSLNDVRPFGGHGFLVCLDLAREGSAVWDSRQTAPLDDKWSFEGSPVCDGLNLYVGMRRSDVRPQAHVACLDAQTGRLRWRRLVCSAETPAQGQEEITHNLLSLHGGTLYYNTNLGAVAALDAASGQVRWIRRYARAKGGEFSKRAGHFFRDLNPAVYDRGMLYAAPSDFPGVMAIEAETGALAWDTWPTSHAEDAVHLLGVSHDHLFATGDKIWSFSTSTGKVHAPFPWPIDKPGGYGRGLLAGDDVYWPMRDRIHVLDAATGDENRAAIDLVNGHETASGGNLIVAGGYLLIVTSDTIYGFELGAKPAEAPKPPAGDKDTN